MSGDRTIAPSAGRRQRAFDAGLRPRARWLTAGAVLLALGALLGQASPDATGAVDTLADALANPAGADPQVLVPVLWDALEWAGWIAATCLAALLIAGLLGPGIGPVDRSQIERLGASRVRPPALVVAGLSLVLVVWAFVALHPSLAGAARAADATQATLLELWGVWPATVCVSMGGAMLAVGIIELLLERRATRIALFQSVEQARQEIKDRGGRRR